jgi:hypothetical protein
MNRNHWIRTFSLIAMVALLLVSCKGAGGCDCPSFRHQISAK